MARAKQLIQKVRRPKPISRAVVKTIDDKYYGPEPTDISIKGFAEALNWYNYMYEPEETRPWLFDYLKKFEYSKSDVAAIRKLPKYKVTKTLCSVARILLNGNQLPEKNMEYFNNTLNELISAGHQQKEKLEDDTTEKVVVSIQDRVRAKANQLLTECEEAIDQDPRLNIYEWLKGKEANSQAATMIRDFYAKWLPDFEEDEFDTRQQKKFRAEQKKYWEAFVADCDRYIGNKKVTKVRKPREKKQRSAIDLVKGLKFQKEFPPLKIVSVTPTDVIGSQQVWAYNTKTRKLTRYDASGPSGIQVKGTTLIGYDVETSLTKSLRKPDITIPSLLKAGKVLLRKFMDDIKTNPSIPSGRINTDTILLRVIR